MGRRGLSDEAHAQEARSQKRVIVTNDTDFLDDRKFPHERTCGVIVIRGDLGRSADYLSAVQTVAKMARRWRGDASGIKFEVTAPAVTATFGQGDKMRYRIADGKLFEWVDE